MVSGLRMQRNYNENIKSRNKLEMKILLSLILTIGVICKISAIDKDDSKKIEIRGIEAFENQNYKEAIDLFEELVQNGFSSSSLYHNLGLSYFQDKNISKSILYLERAQRLDPFNKSIDHNLKIVKESVQSEITSLPKFFLLKWYETIVMLGSATFWLFMHIFFLLTMVVLVYFFLIKGLRIGLHQSYIIGIIIGMLVFSLIFAGFSYSRNFEIQRKDVAIVMQDNTTLRLGAEENSKEVEKINEGVKVYILDQINDFLKIKLEDGTVAWIKNNEIERI